MIEQPRDKQPRQRPGVEPVRLRLRLANRAQLARVGDDDPDTLRLWETGQRTPSETHRDDYVAVLDDLRTG